MRSSSFISPTASSAAIEIVIDYVRHERSATSATARRRPAPPTLHRLTIDPPRAASPTPRSSTASSSSRASTTARGPRHRFVYLPTLTDTLKLANAALRRPSTPCSRSTPRPAPSAPRLRQPHRRRGRLHSRAAAREDDGYLATFLFDPVAGTSDLALLDAAHIDADPVAVIRLPQRVPAGLHGTWVPA